MNGTLVSSDTANVYIDHLLNRFFARLVKISILIGLKLPLQSKE